MVLEESAQEPGTQEPSQEPSIHIRIWLTTSVASINLSVPRFPRLKGDKNDVEM